MAKKNTFGDLNDLLFEQLETLGDRDLDADKLAEEVKRAKAMEGIAAKMIENGRLVLDAQQTMARAGVLGVDELWNPLAPGQVDKRRRLESGRAERGAGK